MIKVTWIDGGREPKIAPNPKYPDGIDVDLSDNRKWACKVDLPYPAKRIGYYALECDECGYRGLITTAGRRDDPRSATVACKKNGAS